jgi:uncharacterized protein (TIGR03118 family)
MSANPKNLRLHRLAEEDALVQTDDGDGIFAPANRDPDGQGHNEFTQTNLVSDGFVPAANIDPNLVSPNEFTQTNLVSDLPGLASYTDPSLVNPWGIAFGPTSPFWISDNGTGLATLYDGAGKPLSLKVTIVGATPTGDVFNGTTGFNITNGSVTAPSRFIFATEDGTISGWNLSVDPQKTVLAVNNADAVYKGLAIGTDADGTFLYATNFSNGMVDVFNSDWNLVNSFTDPKVANGFAPFGVQVLGGNVYVTFAKQDAQGHDDVAGPANGYVDKFSMDGQLLDRVVTRGHLNSPWGLAIAPAGFGEFANDLLVGNFGDGTIDVFDPQTDQYLGKLDGTDGKPIHIDGLWALMPGNSGPNTDPNSIYFTAGLDGEQHGLFGSLTASSVDTSLSQSLLNFAQSTASFGANAQGAGSVTANGDVALGSGGQLTVTRDQAGSPFELVEKIAIASNRDNPTGTPLLNTGEIYLIDPDGTNPQRLTDNTYFDGLPMLSPDGKNIVFDSNRLTADSGTLNISDLFVMELTPRVYSAEATGFLPQIEQTLLTRGSSATWSPDGKYIAFHASASYYASGGTVTGTPMRDDPGAATTDSDLFLANVDDLAAAPDVLSKTQLVTNLTNTPTEIEDDADWSAANGLIAFTSRPVPSDSNQNGRLDPAEIELAYTQTEIYTMDPLHPELEPVQLTFNNNYEERAVQWSPDGTRIVFSARIPEATSREGEICVMNADGSGFQQLTSNTVPDLGASWSPDGTQIAFQRTVGGLPQIFTMNPALNPDGTLPEAHQVTFPPGANLFPQWGEVRTRVGSVVPGDLGAWPEIAADPFTADAHLAGGSDQAVSEYVFGLLEVEHRGIGSAVSAFAHDLHGVTPGGPDQSATNEVETARGTFLSDGTQPANVALLGQYTAASFVGPAGAFGGTPTYDSPPAATLEQTLTQPLHS